MSITRDIILSNKSNIKSHCCRRQLHIGKRSMVFGSIVRSIVRIRKQPMKKPVIWCSLANQQPCYKKLTCACSAENRARSAENRMCSLTAWVIVFSRSESRFTPHCHICSQTSLTAALTSQWELLVLNSMSNNVLLHPLNFRHACIFFFR